MRILVTGGAGYIGTHTIVELAKANHDAVIVDNFSNSSPIAIDRVEKLIGKKIPFYKIDCSDKVALAKVFDEQAIDGAIHFAGFKAVGESVAKPLLYYRNNIDTTLALCEVMQAKGVKKLIFSSSAAVYGPPQELPLFETSPAGQNIPNPYGRSKYIIEEMLRDLPIADPKWQITALRYFNLVGAHESGTIGEDPSGPPNNVLPYIMQVAVGKLEKLSIFGDDYDTPDGTGVRDYIHVQDLARGHVAALEHLPKPGTFEIYNLGTGKGTSVFELLHAAEAACGKKIPYQVVARRPGDVAVCYADASKAEKDLHWKAQKTIEQGCIDAWRWQSQNPHGYRQ